MGFELNITYQLRRWLEFYGSFSGNHTRFTHPFDDGTGHLGAYITDAPVATGSADLYVVNLGRWSGGLEYRYLGDYPLSSGPCVNSAAARDFPAASSCADAPTALGQVNGKGFSELNLDIQYTLPSGWTPSLGIYNALNTRAAAAEFWYVDRLQGEIRAYPEGPRGHPRASARATADARQCHQALLILKASRPRRTGYSPPPTEMQAHGVHFRVGRWLVRRRSALKDRRRRHRDVHCRIVRKLRDLCCSRSDIESTI